MSIIKIRDKDGNEVAVGGKNGVDGKSAYQTAVDNGFAGTEAEWLASLREYPAGGLEGQALVKSTADDTNAVKWGPWPSNPNLLLNWDFRNPVNRNGQSEYTAAGLSIDRWQLPGGTLTVNQDCISWGTSATNSSCQLLQETSNLSVFVGKTLTLTFLTKNNNLYSVTQIVPGTGYVDKLLNVENVPNLRFLFYADTANDIFRVVLRKDLYAFSFEIVAIKLEFGDQQTLAHQDADGNWVLNDPPNYDLQYALCSQYSPTTGEFVGSQHSNPNLLDNWYLADPINQRGQEEYIANGYCIDRWRALSAISNGTVSVSEVGVTLNHTADDNGYVDFQQMIEKYLNQTITFSVLTSNNELYTVSEKNGIIANKYVSDSMALRVTKNAESNTTSAVIRCRSRSEFTLVAVKLELGPVQTLAHKEGDIWVLNDPPPSPSLELLKCQRYFQVFETQSARPTKAADFRPTMRTEPTLSTITVDGKTLYAASADL